MQSKDDYIQFLHQKIDDWNEDIERLRLKADKIEAETRADLQSEINMLKSKRADIEKRITELTDASAVAWEDMKSGLDLAWEATNNAFQSAASRFLK